MSVNLCSLRPGLRLLYFLISSHLATLNLARSVRTFVPLSRIYKPRRSLVCPKFCKYFYRDLRRSTFFFKALLIMEDHSSDDASTSTEKQNSVPRAAAPNAPAPPPDGGLVAWLQVVGAAFLFMNSWYVAVMDNFPTFSAVELKL